MEKLSELEKEISLLKEKVKLLEQIKELNAIIDSYKYRDSAPQYPYYPIQYPWTVYYGNSAGNPNIDTLTAKFEDGPKGGILTNAGKESF